LPRSVLHAVTVFGEPSETFIVDRMLELDRLGWEAWVGARWVIDRHVFDFPPPDRILAPRPRDGLLQRLKSRGAIPDWWWLERPIRKVKPLLVHAHFGWTAAEAIGAAERHGVPLVAGFHGYDATVYPHHGHGFDEKPDAQGEPVLPGVYDELFDKAACILATSRFIASKVRELGCEQDVGVLPSGIRLEWFPYRGPREGGRPEDYRLLFVGRLVPYKGLDLAIHALATLVEEADLAPTLTVIGEGPARREWEALAGSLGVAELIEFRGSQPRRAVLAALNEADVLVAPSRTSAAGQAEGLGNVVKEALAVGLEVAVSDNGGLREVMPAERADELVPEGDAEALAERLGAILRTREQWPERAVAGRRFVEETYDWRKLAPRLADVYRRVSERGP
jgi:colanic acid/amylovoran biosynthesis glycosyltransferase